MTRKFVHPTLLLALIYIIFSAWQSSLDAEDTVSTWPQWRGPNRDGTIKAARWPEGLGEDVLREKWKVKLGPSYSGPIVSEDRVFVTETVDEKFEVVHALDRKTGKEIWQAKWGGAISVPFFAKSNGDWIRATPAYDGERLYVAGMRDLLVCLDAKSGMEVWRVDFVAKLDSKLPAFGFVSSPLVLGDHVFVQAGGGFVKLNKITGEIVWKTLDDGGGMNGSAFSSPYFTRLNGKDQIVVQTRTHLASVDPEAGTVYWKQEVPAFRGMNILTPTVANNAIFTSSYGGKSILFTPETKDEVWTVNESWTSKSQGYMSSPIVIGNHVYLHLRNQRFTCLDLASGEEKWRTTPFGEYWSLVGNGDRILALDENGELLLIQANPEEFKLLDRRKVADNSWAHLAVCDNEVFVRELNAMVVYRWK